MKLVSGSLLVALASTAAIAAAPNPSAPAAAPAPTAQAATAASAERLELARRYVALGNSDDLMQEMRAIMMRSASAEAESPDDQAAANRFFDQVFVLAAPKIRERMPTVLEASAQAYAREFSAAELRDMIAFAETPTGKHYLARGAAVETDPAILDAHMGIWQDLAPIMQQVGTDMAKEACAKKAAARVAAGDKKATCPLAKAAETQQG
jgi:hypothetical protein